MEEELWVLALATSSAPKTARAGRPCPPVPCGPQAPGWSAAESDELAGSLTGDQGHVSFVFEPPATGMGHGVQVADGLTGRGGGAAAVTHTAASRAEPGRHTLVCPSQGSAARCNGAQAAGGSWGLARCQRQGTRCIRWRQLRLSCSRWAR